MMNRETNRLRVLRSTELLDSPPELAFDRLTRVSARLLGVPVALVSLVDEHRQFFKSALGLQEPWASRRETPLSHSFCQHVTRDRAPLVVNDARQHPTLRDNLALPDLGVIAYAGMPLVVDQEAIGALCVIDDKPRIWSKEDLVVLEDLAQSVVTEIQLRLSIRAAQSQRFFQNALLESIGDAVLAIDPACRLIVANEAARELFGAQVEAGQPMPSDWNQKQNTRPGETTPLTWEDGPLGRALRGMDTNNLTFSVQRTNMPEPIWLEATGRPVRGEAANVIAAVSVCRDVTKKKKHLDLYTALASNLPGGALILFDKHQSCLAVEGSMLQTDGVEPEALIGKSLRAIVGYAEGDARFDPIDEIHRRVFAGEIVTRDFPFETRTMSVRAAPVRDGLGQITAAIVLVLDVTTERGREAALHRSEQVYRAITKHLPNGAIFMVDRDLRYTVADGPEVEEIMRRSNIRELTGRLVTEVSSDANRDTMIDLYQGVFRGESRYVEVKRDGRFFDLSAVPIFEGEHISHALVFLQDVTAKKAEIAELRDIATTDELTGLLNRRGFLLLAEQQMKVAARTKRELVLLFVDLNGMKIINDKLGHQEGDRALVDTASILRKVFRSSDVIARLGGDEFVVLAAEAGTPLVAEKRLKEALEQYNRPEAAFRLSFSTGATVFDPLKPLSLQKLLADADARMYEEKTTRRFSNYPRVKIT